MCSKCDNCELFLAIEEERIQWYKELTAKNIKLHKKVVEQQELISILKQKLLQKRTNFVADFLTDFVDQTSKQIVQSDLVSQQNLKEKLLEVNEFVEAFNSERESIQQEIVESEKFFAENVSYLNGQIEYFRDSLFQELDKSNKIKQYFIRKISGIALTNHHVLLDTLKEESEKLNNELKSRYQKTIQKSKEEIERQTLLVSKLRKHNRQLYSIIQKSKVENKSKISNLERNIKDLKMTIRRLKDKNEYLYTQIKLEVEGCQNDIYDTRKKLRTLNKLQS